MFTRVELVLVAIRGLADLVAACVKEGWPKPRRKTQREGVGMTTVTLAILDGYPCIGLLGETGCIEWHVVAEMPPRVELTGEYRFMTQQLGATSLASEFTDLLAHGGRICSCVKGQKAPPLDGCVHARALRVFVAFRGLLAMPREVASRRIWRDMTPTEVLEGDAD